MDAIREPRNLSPLDSQIPSRNRRETEVQLGDCYRAGGRVGTGWVRPLMWDLRNSKLINTNSVYWPWEISKVRRGNQKKYAFEKMLSCLSSLPNSWEAIIGIACNHQASHLLSFQCHLFSSLHPWAVWLQLWWMGLSPWAACTFLHSLSHHSSKMYYLLLTKDRTLLPGVDSLDQTAALGLLSAWVLQVQKY